MSGILFLIIATVCAAMFSISFKIFQKKNIDSDQAIFFNYLTAFILGVLFSLNGEIVVNPVKADWFIPVILLGLIFMAGMVVLSDSTRRNPAWTDIHGRNGGTLRLHPPRRCCNIHGLQPCVDGNTHNRVIPVD